LIFNVEHGCMSDHQLLPVQPRGRGSSTVSLRRTLAIIMAIAVVGALAASAFVIVNPTEMAGKRRLGRVVVDQPLGPGLHVKLPLVEEIDKLQTSLETYKLDRLMVNTVDNQPITVAVGLTTAYRPAQSSSSSTRSGGPAISISPTTSSGSSPIARQRSSPNRIRRRSARIANACRPR
jgi:regulator of protease activity HflC (stomatin/prohibitin superfamily)